MKVYYMYDQGRATLGERRHSSRQRGAGYGEIVQAFRVLISPASVILPLCRAVQRGIDLPCFGVCLRLLAKDGCVCAEILVNSNLSTAASWDCWIQCHDHLPVLCMWDAEQ